MASRTLHADGRQRAAHVEDFLEDEDGTAVLGTRQSANVAARRSIPADDHATASVPLVGESFEARNRVGYRASQYYRVKVFVVAWEENRHDPSSKDEAGAIARVFSYLFQYEVVLTFLNRSPKQSAQDQITDQVRKFTAGEEGVNTLLIFYYIGYRQREFTSESALNKGSELKSLLISSSDRILSYRRQKSDVDVWTAIKTVLSGVRTDILLILDCNFASECGRPSTDISLRGVKLWEVLAATSSVTPCSGENSFTSAVVWSLHRLIMEKSKIGIAIAELTEKIREAPHFPEDQVPLHFEASRRALPLPTIVHTKKIMLAPLPVTGNSARKQPLNSKLLIRSQNEVKPQDEDTSLDLDGWDFTDVLDSQADLDFSTLTSSGSIIGPMMPVLFANKFTKILQEDIDLKHFRESVLPRLPALLPAHSFWVYLQRLLADYAANLLQGTEPQVELSAARAIERHRDKVVGFLFQNLKAAEAIEAARIKALSQQQASKFETIGEIGSKLSNTLGRWSLFVDLDDDNQSSLSWGDKQVLTQRFESVEAFLFDGAAFIKLKEELRKYPYLQDAQRRAISKDSLVAGSAMSVKQQVVSESNVEPAREVTRSLENRPEKSGLPKRSDEGKSTMVQPLTYFEECDTTASFSDHSKAFVERLLGQTLLWWPLKEPYRPLAGGMRRLIWRCDCGSKVFFDVPLRSDALDSASLPASSGPISYIDDSRSRTDSSRSHADSSQSHTDNSHSHTDNSQSHATISQSHNNSSQARTDNSQSHAATSQPYASTPQPHAGNSQSLPLHNQPSLNPVSPPSQHGVPTFPPSQTQSTPPNRSNQPVMSQALSGPGTIYMNTHGQFIYWCIGMGEAHAEVVELNALQLTDHEFGRRLLSEYAMVTGWLYRFWTMTSCSGASFRKFRYLYDNRNIVSCGKNPELPDHPQYRYVRRDPREEYRCCLEARIAHHLQEHAGVKWPWSANRTSPTSFSTTGSQQLLQYIPKLVPQGLEAKEFNQGYGMQAVASVAISRVLAMFLIWHSGSVIFLVYWLTRHPGDVQNAFMILTTTLAGFMVYLEILLRFRK